MKNWKKVILTGFILGLIGGSIGLYMYFKPVESTSGMETDVKISATELFEAYGASEDEANAKYLGKVLEVSGEVMDIRTTDAGRTALVLATSDGMFGIQCELEEGVDATSVKSGQNITVKGVCSGLLLDVVLTRCTL